MARTLRSCLCTVYSVIVSLILVVVVLFVPFLLFQRSIDILSSISGTDAVAIHMSSKCRNFSICDCNWLTRC